MKIFLSWSGPRSEKVAKALKDWMPDVIQDVECVLSSPAPHEGQGRSEKTNTGIAEAGFGILCVTADNRDSPWLNFEAGALASTLKPDDENRLVPIAFDFPVGSLDYPLRQFNGVAADRAGMHDLMTSVNAIGSGPHGDELDRAFDLCWPRLEARFSEIVTESGMVVEPGLPRLDDDRVQEVLEVVRAIANVQVSRPADEDTRAVER